MKVEMPGWVISRAGDVVTLRYQGRDCRRPGVFRYSDSFVVDPGWSDDQIIDRVFCVVQYVTDHELRESFVVDGVRRYDAHALGVTGEQRDWFVERQAALRGY